MIEWLPTDAGVRAVGRGGSVTLDTDGWTTEPSLPLPYPCDAGIAGRATGLELDAALAADTETPANGRLDGGTHLLRTADDGLAAAVRFEGPATLDADDASTALRFAEPSAVAVGVREPTPEPETLAAPRSPAGVASAVTVAGGRLPRGPERSFAPTRPHPPLVSFDGDTAPTTDSRGIEFHVPDDLEHVLVAAPLAYYLGAELSVDGDAAPLLSVPETGFEYAFGSLPAFSTEVAAALRRIVHLDRAARVVENERVNREPLTALGLDTDSVGRVSPAVRYATFLDADLGSLPNWHLSTYVEADYERALALPSLLDRLSLVYPAEATEMSPQDLLTSSLDDFYRGAVSVTPLAPELGVGDAHAWLADGEVVDAFKATPQAFDHARTRRAEGDSVSVTVVLNDPEMDAELAVADAYRERAGTVPLSVEVHESLSVAELADVLESPTDFLHYVGHCETAGLRCPDGHLSASSLDRSGARAFFLNACGSYREGEELIARGSVAGAVTLEKVLNEQAATVGTAFGRLVAAGYGVDRALSLARSRIMMGKDYAALGDGTARIAPTVGERAVLTVEAAATGRFELTYEAAPGAGGSYRDPFTGDLRPRGEPARATVSRERLAEFLDGRVLPVRFDGDLRWSDDLAAELCTTRGASRRSVTID